MESLDCCSSGTEYGRFPRLRLWWNLMTRLLEYEVFVAPVDTSRYLFSGYEEEERVMSITKKPNLSYHSCASIQNRLVSKRSRYRGGAF